MSKSTRIYINSNEAELLFDLLNNDVIYTEYDDQDIWVLKDILIEKINNKLHEVM